jgi:beta-xylosidase
VHVGDTYYCATSTFDAFPGLPVYASKDLVNWKHISNAWNRKGQLPGIDLQTRDQQSGMSAPNLRFHDGLFYMTCVYTGVNTTSEINGTIFTTPDPYHDEAWSIPFVWEAPSGLSTQIFSGMMMGLHILRGQASSNKPSIYPPALCQT